MPKEDNNTPLIFKDKFLAFVYNVRHKYPSLTDPETFLEVDFDDQETIDAMIKHFKNLGFEVLPIEADLKAEETLLRNKEKIGLIFNYSERVLGVTPKKFMSEIYEKHNLPFTGCSDSTQKIIMDKGLMQDLLLKNNVSTLPYQVFTNKNEVLNKELTFPLIVKPVSEGSSAGITNKSVVKNEEELKRQVDLVVKTFDGKALVEPFLTGREFSVGMIDNPPKILPIVQPNHEKLPKGYYPLDSLEVKWIFEEEMGTNYFDCPAKINKTLKREIEEMCLKTWEVLKIRDFCRIDLRMNGEKIYVLDVNSPPGLIPPEISETSYLPFAAKVMGLTYDQLLLKVIEAASFRLNL
jgi:D-alanine-D-alanine ligase